MLKPLLTYIKSECTFQYLFIYLFSLFTLHTEGEDKRVSFIFAEKLSFAFSGSHILASAANPT